MDVIVHTHTSHTTHNNLEGQGMVCVGSVGVVGNVGRGKVRVVLGSGGRVRVRILSTSESGGSHERGPTRIVKVRLWCGMGGDGSQDPVADNLNLETGWKRVQGGMRRGADESGSGVFAGFIFSEDTVL